MKLMKPRIKNIKLLLLMLLAVMPGVIQAQTGEQMDTLSREMSELDRLPGETMQGNWVQLYQKRAMMYFDRALMGEKSGVYFSGNGISSNAGLLMLRGLTSIHLNTTPYIIVDGLPVRHTPNVSPFSSGLTRTNIGFINPLDVADVRILNRGYEASHYGGKAGNGLLYINIDKGTMGSATIDFTTRVGFSEASYDLDMMGSTDFRTYLYSMMQSKGIYESELQENILFDASHAKYNHNTDWMKAFKRAGSFLDAHLKMKGGDGDTRYLFSIGYTRESETIKELKDERLNIRYNLDYRITPTIMITNLFSYNYGNSRFLGAGTDWDVNPIYVAATKAPFMSPYNYTDDGIYTNNMADYDQLGKSNPYLFGSNLLNTGRSNRIDAVISTEWKFIPKMRANVDVVVSYNSYIDKLHRKAAGIVPDRYIERQNSKRTYSEYLIRGDMWVERVDQLNDEIVYTVKAGGSMEFFQEKMIYARSVNGATDEIVTVEKGQFVDSVANNRFEHRLMNFYATASFEYQQKLTLDVNVNIERSSNFGRHGGWNFYGGAHLNGWLLRNGEHSLNAFVSWGRTGNHDVRGAYYLRMYKPTSYHTYGGIYLGNIENRDLKPEITNNYDLGLEASFFRQNLNLTLSYYIRNTHGLVTTRAFPIEIGLDPQYNNEGKIRNQGLELSAALNLYRNKSVNCSFFANFSTLKNEVSSLKNGEIVYADDKFTGVAQKGSAVGSFYGYKVKGVFNHVQEVNLLRADMTSYKAGDYKIDDTNNDGVINGLDRQIIGNPFPDFYGGFGFDLSWKRLHVHTLFTYSYGNDVYNLFEQKLNSMSDYSNQSVKTLDRWLSSEQPGNSFLPRAAYGDPSDNFATSDRWVEDGSYLKWKNISLSYDIPIKNKTGFVKGVCLSLSCSNLLTLTGYKGFDPEVFSSQEPLFRGVDCGANPNPRSYIFGLKLSL